MHVMNDPRRQPLSYISNELLSEFELLAAPAVNAGTAVIVD